MSDDEDYMSDKFLLGTEKYSTPNINRRAADQRELELLKRKAEIEARLKEKTKSTRVIEQETREKGLSSAISSDNKGYKLLAKMGYTPGQGIGKKETGISEPISIDLKTNRLGLGKAPKIKQTASRNATKKEPVLNTDDFRSRMAQKKNEQIIEADLRKSQMCCELLDSQNDVKTPNETWFWPIVKETHETDSESDENDEVKSETEEDTTSSREKLLIINKYLRDKYFYCIWCGATYDDGDDLRDNCPGTTRDDH